MATTGELHSVTVETSPFEGQKPGTSGLRKKVKEFMQKHYTENFVQCILDANKERLAGCTLVVGGDGRYFNKQAVNIIVRMSAANGVARLVLGQNGIMSTPAVSAMIRARHTLGGIVLTASHNPGGIRNDFGIKFNIENGGPAPDAMSDHVYRLTQTIDRYRTTPNLDCEHGRIGEQKFLVDGREFVVEVVDPVDVYLQLMKRIFDFEKLRALLAGSGDDRRLKILLDSMNGVTGVYVKRIFLEELGSGPESAVRIIPLDNFGEIHPDPNLTYAKDLVDRVRSDTSVDLGAAFDGDGDRNMILGKGAFFVTPSDSLAVIADNLHCIPYFRENGVRGFARSMPTGTAVDRVAERLGKEMFEVPTGWKYFGNLMDAGRLSLCGEESFGTGSDHIREKDGLWAVLAWLSIVEARNLGVEQILHEHWKKYGRNYFTRYDYEECDAEPCARMMQHLEELIVSKGFVGRVYEHDSRSYVVRAADNFSYVDPIDGSVAKAQGIRIMFEDGSRLVFRLSGTGASGAATVRLYVDSYEKDDWMSETKLGPLVAIALQLSRLKEFTGRDEPTVIT